MSNIGINIELFATIAAARDWENFQAWQSTRQYAEWCERDPRIVAKMLREDLTYQNGIRLKMLVLAGDL